VIFHKISVLQYFNQINAALVSMRALKKFKFQSVVLTTLILTIFTQKNKIQVTFF